MPKFNVDDRVKVLDKPNWPDGGYKIANWEGMIVQIVEDPAGYVMMKADKTGYDMLFHEKGLELLHPEQISDHDGTLAFYRCIAAKDKRKPSS